MQLKLVEYFGKGFREHIEEDKFSKTLLLFEMDNQISKDYYKEIILYIAWSNKVFKRAYGKEYFVELGYYLTKGIIQGQIKYI